MLASLVRAKVQVMIPVTHYRCPGCGDLADAAHMAACCGMMKRQARRAGAAAAFVAVSGAITKQLARRGSIDFRALRKMMARYVLNQGGDTW